MLTNISFAHRERRIKFEAHLAKEKTKMETFRLRETKEFLSLDELEEKCNISDNFMEILKVFSYFYLSDEELKTYVFAITCPRFACLRVFLTNFFVAF